MTKAREIIARLGLAPHPEGGWYRQTWQADPGADGRARGTMIHFLLEAGPRSHWHRVDADELWLWHAGSPITLGISTSDDGPVVETLLGGDILAGAAVQALVPTGAWQAADARNGWALVSCIVVPGFRFEGFTLADPGWAPGGN